MKRRKKFTTKPPPTTTYEAMIGIIQNYFIEIDERDVEATAKEGLTLEECDKKRMEIKRKQAKEGHRQEVVMMGLKKLKKEKKKVDDCGRSRADRRLLLTDRRVC